MDVIRPATAADVEPLLDLCEHVAYPEGTWKHVGFSREALRATLMVFLPGQVGQVFVAIGADGLTGFAICFLNRYFFSDDVYASDLSFYVRKDRRGSSTGRRLIAAMRDFATRHDAKELLLTVNSGIDVDRSVRFLERLGARRIGASLSLPLSRSR